MILVWNYMIFKQLLNIDKTLLAVLSLNTVLTQWVPRAKPKIWRKIKKMAVIYHQHHSFLECMLKIKSNQIKGVYDPPLLASIAKLNKQNQHLVNSLIWTLLRIFCCFRFLLIIISITIALECWRKVFTDTVAAEN